MLVKSNAGQINNKIKKKTIDLFRKNFKTLSFDRKSLDKVCLTFMHSLDIKDALATLIAIITEIIYIKVKKYNLKKIIVTGGGRKNYALVKNLQSKFAAKILVAEDINLDGDSLEAEAFAYLAVRSLLGKSFSFKNTTGVSKNSSGGILFYYKG